MVVAIVPSKIPSAATVRVYSVAPARKRVSEPAIWKASLRWHYRHDKQMLHRALLTLRDERCSRQDYCQHGNIIDDLHDGREPVRIEVRIELGADHDIDWRYNRSLSASLEVSQLLRDDGLNVDGAAGGRHGRDPPAPHARDCGANVGLS